MWRWSPSRPTVLASSQVTPCRLRPDRRLHRIWPSTAGISLHPDPRSCPTRNPRASNFRTRPPLPPITTGSGHFASAAGMSGQPADLRPQTPGRGEWRRREKEVIRTRRECHQQSALAARVPPVFASCRPVLPFNSSVPSTRTSGTVATVFKSAHRPGSSAMIDSDRRACRPSARQRARPGEVTTFSGRR